MRPFNSSSTAFDLLAVTVKLLFACSVSDFSASSLPENTTAPSALTVTVEVSPASTFSSSGPDEAAAAEASALPPAAAFVGFCPLVVVELTAAPFAALCLFPVVGGAVAGSL